MIGGIMRAILLSLLLLPVYATSVGAAPPPSSKKPPVSLCRASEQVLFDCQMDERIASVCRTGQAITFRFSSPENRSIQITSNGRDGRTHQFYIRGGGHGGFSRGLRFSQDGVEFIPFFGRAGELTDVPGKRSSGLEIQKKHISLATHRCKETKRDDLDIPDFVPEETDKGYLVWY